MTALISTAVRITLTGLFLLALAGCQTLKLARAPEVPALVPPQQDMASFQLSQRLKVRMPNGDTRQLLVVTTLAPDRAQLNGLSSTGQRLLEIRWNGKTLDVWQAPGMDKPLPAKWLLAQIQLAYLPEAVLRRHYSGNWSLQTDTGKRHLLLEGASTITVTCRAPLSGGKDCLVPGASVLIEHHRSGLFIQVDTLKVVKRAPTGAGSGHPSGIEPLTAGWPEHSSP